MDQAPHSDHRSHRLKEREMNIIRSCCCWVHVSGDALARLVDFPPFSPRCAGNITRDNEQPLIRVEKKGGTLLGDHAAGVVLPIRKQHNLGSIGRTNTDAGSGN